MKVLMPVALSVLTLRTGMGRQFGVIAYVIACVAGFLVPDFWLQNRMSNRQKRIRLGLPDALDMLVICIEAGLGVDQATARTAQELRLAQPVITDEMGIIVLEQQAGRPRSDAWRHFAERANVDSVRNLVTVLVQS